VRVGECNRDREHKIVLEMRVERYMSDNLTSRQASFGQTCTYTRAGLAPSRGPRSVLHLWTRIFDAQPGSRQANSSNMYLRTRTPRLEPGRIERTGPGHEEPGPWAGAAAM